MNELVLKDFSGAPEITPGAFELKRKALAACSPIRNVTTADEQVVAVKALRQVKEVLSGMEATRKAVKRPVLDLGRKIDELAHGFTRELEKQYGRLSGLINHYQRKQAQVKQEATDGVESKAALAAELRRKAKVIRDAPECTVGQLHEAERMEAEAFDLEMNVETAIVPGIEKPKGLVVKNRINFQVMDAIVFCQAHPDFWKWNPETETLKLDRMRILDELNRDDQRGIFHMTRFPEELSQQEDRRLVQPVGLRVYEETKAHVR